MKATVTLGVDLHQQLRTQPGNLLVSPYSIWVALAMLYPGARGAARRELGEHLGITSVDAVSYTSGELARRAGPDLHQQQMIDGGYAKPDSYGFHLSIANKLWVQNGYRIAPAYAAALAQAFGVDPAPVDFAGAPDAACAAINRWVNDQTRGRIPTIVSSPRLIDKMRALLANAIYFKAAWQDEFFERSTAPAPFHLLAGGPVDVPLMRLMTYRAYAADGDLEAVELPYIRPEVAMVVIVPRAGTFLRAEQSLTADRVRALVGALATRRVDLHLPKFRFETSLSILPQLRAIGFSDALGPTADLSGISEESGFHVGEVMHKTFIAVDEKGTEAAAVTAMAFAGCAPPRDEPLLVRVDRPFYVLIHDKPTGTALFFGRVVDPR